MTDFIDKIIRQIDSTYAFYFGCSIIFGVWLLRTSLGRKALIHSAPRGNNMPLFMPFVVLFIWALVTSTAIFITQNVSSDTASWQSVLVKNFVISFSYLIAIIATLFIARAYFARRLKGFGLSIKTFIGDFFAAIINLLTISPLVLSAIIVTMHIGRLIYGGDFQITRHEDLEAITQYTQWPVRIIILINACLLAPIWEEIMFRGLFQTAIRSTLQKTWASVCISSAIFVAAHIDKSHWLALFVLSMGLGYTYEKSGSLLRAIVMHSLFNTSTIIAAMFG